MIARVSELSLNTLTPLLVQFSASAFVGKTAGKLKDFYRIGKVLGNGKSEPA